MLRAIGEFGTHLKVADKILNEILISYPVYLRRRRRVIAHRRNIVFVNEARVPNQAVVVPYW